MDQRTRYYVLTQYYLRNGTQIGRVHDYVKGGLIPALERMIEEDRPAAAGLEQAIDSLDG